MTKCAYFEMCEALGTEPLDSEIPVEFEDLLLDVQEALVIYSMLQDSWDHMNGNYTGKNYSGLFDILTLQDVSDKKTIFKIIGIADVYRGKAIAARKPKNPAK